MVDHVALHRDRHHGAERAEQQGPQDQRRQGQVHTLDHQQCRNCRDHRAARRITGRAGRRLHAVGFQDGHWRFRQTDLQEAVPNRVGHDASGNRDAKRPARLQADIEVSEGEQEAECRTHQDRAHGQLREIFTPVDLFVPLVLVHLEDFVRRNRQWFVLLVFLLRLGGRLEQGHATRVAWSLRPRRKPLRCKPRP